jgi:hypothetical protein
MDHWPPLAVSEVSIESDPQRVAPNRVVEISAEGINYEGAMYKYKGCIRYVEVIDVLRRCRVGLTCPRAAIYRNSRQYMASGMLRLTSKTMYVPETNSLHSLFVLSTRLVIFVPFLIRLQTILSLQFGAHQSSLGGLSSGFTAAPSIYYKWLVGIVRVSCCLFRVSFTLLVMSDVWVSHATTYQIRISNVRTVFWLASGK